jgi:hypothetical protein
MHFLVIRRLFYCVEVVWSSMGALRDAPAVVAQPWRAAAAAVAAAHSATITIAVCRWSLASASADAPMQPAAAGCHPETSSWPPARQPRACCPYCRHAIIYRGQCDALGCPVAVKTYGSASVLKQRIAVREATILKFLNAQG